jgi:hypothetical protein
VILKPAVTISDTFRSAMCSASFDHLEILIGDLQIMLFGNDFAVADPCTGDVQRKPCRQVGLTGRPKILECLFPDFKSGSLDDFVRRRSQVGPTEFDEDMDRTRFGLRKCLGKNRVDFGKDRVEKGVILIYRVE